MQTSYHVPSYQIPSESCTNQERRDFWAKVVIDQKASSMSLVKFCQLHGLKFSTFKGYLYPKRNTKTRHSAKNSDRLRSARKDKDTAKFIPLQIATDAINRYPKNEVVDDNNNGNNRVTDIKVIFKNNHKLILSPSLPEAHLLSIIKIVAEL